MILPAPRSVAWSRPQLRQNTQGERHLRDIGRLPLRKIVLGLTPTIVTVLRPR